MSLCLNYDGFVSGDCQTRNASSRTISACRVQTQSFFVNGTQMLPRPHSQSYLADKYPNWGVVNFVA